MESILDLPREVSEGLDRYQEGVLTLNKGIQRLKSSPLTIPQGKDMIFDIFEKKIVSTRLFYPVVQSFRKTIEPRSLWSLNNCFTEHVKTLRPGPAFQAHIKLGQFFSLTSTST